MNVNDNINMEYEARVMITEQEYLKVKNYYLSSNLPYKELVNENYYFDTKDLKLINNHKVLRLRKINNQKYELTLKIQGKDGAIEINHYLTDKEKDDLVKSSTISYKPIISKLLEIGVDPKEIRYITDLKTERIEVSLEDGLLVIDKNYYRGLIDYNLEVESCAESRSKAILLRVISQFNIEYKKDYVNKARRATHNL